MVQLAPSRLTAARCLGLVVGGQVNLVLNPVLSGLPGPLKVLASLVPSVAIMVWIVLLWLTRLFSKWLHPR